MPDQLRPTRVGFFQTIAERPMQHSALAEVRDEARREASSGEYKERIIAFATNILALPDGRWLVTASVVFEALADGWSE